MKMDNSLEEIIDSEGRSAPTDNAQRQMEALKDTMGIPTLPNMGKKRNYLPTPKEGNMYKTSSESKK